LRFKFDGDLYINLQFGSDSDNKCGIGLEQQDSLKFTSCARVKIKDLDDLTCDDIEFLNDGSHQYVPDDDRKCIFFDDEP
jgi:hypothetical protein